MKIICTLDEYTRMIRMCNRGKELNECKGCVMANICGEDLIEDAVQFEVDEIEIEYVTLEGSE